MNQAEILRLTADHVQSLFEREGTGHDWWHIRRVWLATQEIAREEGADPFIAELGALLHDIADFKFHNGDETAGPKAARSWLEQPFCILAC